MDRVKTRVQINEIERVIDLVCAWFMEEATDFGAEKEYQALKEFLQEMLDNRG